MSAIEFWINPLTDKRHRILGAGHRYRYAKIPSHAAIRALIHLRDNFTCLHCGRQSTTLSFDYDGFEAIEADDGTLLVIDHIVSLRMGGTNHPDNLRTLCDPCNARKACIVEGAGGTIYNGRKLVLQ